MKEPIKLIRFDEVFPSMRGYKPLTRSQFIRLAKRVQKAISKESLERGSI